MNTRRILLLAVVICATAAAVLWFAFRHATRFEPLPEPRVIPHAFYLWQYEWTPAVAEAVADSIKLAPDSLYIIAGEVGGSMAPQPDWAALKAVLPPTAQVIPVIRVHGTKAKQIETAPGALARELRVLIGGLRGAAMSAGIDLREIQLDLDCPERLLPAYAQFLHGLKPQLSGLRLSITAIPCHMENSSFAAVAKVADGYTLQVHGVQFPKTIDDSASIMDSTIARRAIIAAERLGIPYRLAMPTYAYRFVFGSDGKCRGILQPFSPPPESRGNTVRTIAADPVAVLEIYQFACHTRGCSGITWFRLPVKGDDACWELAAIAAIRAGRPVDRGLRTEWLPAANDTCELRLINHAVLDARIATVTIRWPMRQGDYGLVAAEASAEAIPGILPEKLSVPVPPPGESVTLAWFRAAPYSSATITVAAKPDAEAIPLR
jgi:hypothetical protein